MTNDTTIMNLTDATAIFDQLATEIYYGFNLRATLVGNPDLAKVVKELVELARDARTATTD